MSDFFNNNTPTGDTKMDTTVQPEKIKLGEVEYTQDDLSRLVGLGSRYDELDKKTGGVDKMVAGFGKRGEEIGQLRKELDDLKNRTLSQKQDQGQQLSQDELKQIAKQQARELGLMTQDDLDSFYVTRRAAEKLVEDVDSMISEAKSKGQPETTKEDLLKHMQETGIRNPQKAYKDLFETELESWKEQQTKKAVMPGLYSNTNSTAGAKVPPKVEITRDNLKALLHEQLLGGLE
jgi:hypothetical protein